MSNLDPIRDGRHYDALKAQNDVPFYLSQAEMTRGPVLEIGCGTGRVTIPLAAAGAEITGLDVSASMLEEGKRKAQERGATVRWVEADARHFDLGRRFAAILMPFNTLQFFRDKPSLTQVFDRVKCHLEEDGRFILDVLIRRSPSSQLIRCSDRLLLNEKCPTDLRDRLHHQHPQPRLPCPSWKPI